MSEVARPGDVLLVPIADIHRWPHKTLTDMEKAIKLSCPGIRVVLFVPGSGNIMIFRPADPPRHDAPRF